MLAPFSTRYKQTTKKRLLEAVRGPFNQTLDSDKNAVTINRMTAESLLGMANQQSPTFRMMHSTPFVTMNPLDIEQCFAALDTGVGHACLQRINAELTQSGLRFARQDGEIIPTERMHAWTENVLLPLQQEALRAICAIGVVPIAFEKDPVSGFNLPYVPAPNTYTIGVAEIRGRLFFMLYWVSRNAFSRLRVEQNASKYGSRTGRERLVVSGNEGNNVIGQPDASVTILHGFNHDPGVDGTIRSVVAAFLDSVLVANEFKRNARIAEHINANPPVVRQHSNKDQFPIKESQRISESVGEGVVDTVTEGAARRANSQFFRTNEQIAAYNAQEREANENLASLLGKPINDDKPMCAAIARNPHGYDATDAKGNTMPWVNELVIPEQWTTTSIAQPRPRSDLVALLDNLTTDVFMAFLIPRQALDASARLVADATTAKETTEIAVAVWKRALSSVLTFAHDASYLNYDITEMAQEIVRKNRQQRENPDDDSPPFTEDQINDLIQKIGYVRITYRSKPTTSNEMLERLYARGILEWEDYTHYTAQLNGLDPDRVAETDKLTLEASRMVGMPEYGSYVQAVDARKREDTRASETQAALKQRDKEMTLKTATTKQNDNDDDVDDPPAAKKKRTTKKK